jgi:hypothetical protein
MILDLLACPNCGCPFTDGKPCNLTCSREYRAKQEAEAAKEGAKARRFLAELKAVTRVNVRPGVMNPRETDDFLRVLGG